MVEINPSVLVCLVQIVDEKLALLKQEVLNLDADDEILPDLEEEMLACSEAAMELKRCYHDAVKTVGNLPPYENLVPTGMGRSSGHRL